MDGTGVVIRSANHEHGQTCVIQVYVHINSKMRIPYTLLKYSRLKLDLQIMWMVLVLKLDLQIMRIPV